MYRLESLSTDLISVWNELYRRTNEEHKDSLNTISKAHKNKLNNEVKESMKHLFVEKNLKEIAKNNNLNSPYKELLDSIYEANYMISWYPNPTFQDEEVAIENENYCANLVGKLRESQSNPYLFYNEEIMSGLFLMGPNKVYPAHYHPAKETWLVLSGKAQWKKGDGEWKVKKPEDQFTFEENESHSMKTGDEPLLAIWAWTGDLDSWAKWT